MFNIGDIVRCISRRYKYTSYMRPCTVRGYAYPGKVLVEPFDDGSVYGVEDKYFEVVPHIHILKEGQEIKVKGIDYKNEVNFVKYLDKGMVKVKVNGHHKAIDIEKVIYERGFYI